MNTEGKLLQMLTGYAAAHQHPFNIFVHMIGIPTIMLGVLIPLTWIGFEINSFHFLLAHLIIAGMFIFYLTLDVLFALVFAIGAYFLTMLAAKLGSYPGNTGWAIAAACFFGGYAAQFVGHAVEKSMPVLIKHPVQANLAAPFFTVVELFKIAGLREELFNSVQLQIALQRKQQTDAVT
ncbi:MAG: DUF962 domain-containing protein [Gammaproteobacteria bacterium]|nr:DUF962 domain-containing protein [Gammaproteobacteria bacterium]MDH5241377.1 DUF962 domain-containing protein [Gammaproteobacteria bacterium]MDH5260209.1 DUF962 domain-containing protein [Gammaproteobacteria bacterium]